MYTEIICRLDPLTEDERVELLALADRRVLIFARSLAGPPKPRRGMRITKRESRALDSATREVHRSRCQPVQDARTEKYRKELLVDAKEVDRLLPPEALSERQLQEALQRLADRLVAIAYFPSGSDNPSFQIIAKHRQHGLSLAEAVGMAVSGSDDPHFVKSLMEAARLRALRHGQRERGKTPK